MSTPNPRPQQATPRPQQAPIVKPNPAPAPARKPAKAAQPKKEYTFLFDRDNYILMAAGVLLIFIGFQLMSGRKSPDPHQFNYAEIYTFRRITLAPVVVILGFEVEVFAIMKKPKETI